ncbi:MAG: MBL fold metallo-hydrolase [Deltaproteobacteria bacterium]|nr:MBL fold metallo-hydrolase [Deltaproteobacteria bacterium]
MIFTGLEVGPLQTNCYIAGDEASKEAAVIDPGGDADRILAVLKKHGLKCTAIVITHAHFDHVGACAEIKEKTGAPVVTHVLEKDALPMQGRMAMFFGAVMKDPPPPDRTVEEGDTIKVGSIEMKVIHTPGHSAGGICLAIEAEKTVIVGDTLFADSIGRTDFPGGSYDDLIGGVREKIFPLGDDWKVYPGHGPATTIGHERRHNPFF